MRVNDDSAWYNFPLSYSTICSVTCTNTAGYNAAATAGTYGITKTGFYYKNISDNGTHWDELSCVIAVGY